MHGANATGRPFTGDYAGILLYETLHAYGFASSARRARADDGADAHRLPDHQCGQVPAAGEQAHAGRGARLQRLPRRGPRRACPRAPRSWRSAASRTTRRCVRWASAAAPIRSRTAARHALASACDAVRQLSLQPLQHQHRRLTPQMFRAVFDAIAAHLGRAPARPADRQGRAAELPMTKIARHNRRTVDAEAGAATFDARELLASLPHRAGCLPDVRRGGRDALRRQGARPQEARVQLLPEDRPRAADRRDDRAGRARRDHGRRAPRARRCCSRTT